MNSINHFGKEKKMRYGIFMLIGVAMNLGFYYIAHTFALPVWMDSIGTAYVAVMVEPAAGLLVAFATNFFQAAVIYESSSLVYYAVSAMAALTLGIVIRKNGRICMKRLPVALLLYMVTATILAAGITLWRTNGLPDSGWERHFYQMALGWNFPNVAACFFGTLILKAGDSVIIGAALCVFKVLTPNKYITQDLPQIVSWKEPYFNKTVE